ncbi:hypothetical protein SK128_024295, partial [Halocaridina rubra]
MLDMKLHMLTLLENRKSRAKMETGVLFVFFPFISFVLLYYIFIVYWCLPRKQQETRKISTEEKYPCDYRGNYYPEGPKPLPDVEKDLLLDKWQRRYLGIGSKNNPEGPKPLPDVEKDLFLDKWKRRYLSTGSKKLQNQQAKNIIARATIKDENENGRYLCDYRAGYNPRGPKKSPDEEQDLLIKKAQRRYFTFGKKRRQSYHAKDNIAWPIINNENDNWRQACYYRSSYNREEPRTSPDEEKKLLIERGQRSISNKWLQSQDIKDDIAETLINGENENWRNPGYYRGRKNSEGRMTSPDEEEQLLSTRGQRRYLSIGNKWLQSQRTQNESPRTPINDENKNWECRINPDNVSHKYLTSLYSQIIALTEKIKVKDDRIEELEEINRQNKRMINDLQGKLNYSKNYKHDETHNGMTNDIVYDRFIPNLPSQDQRPLRKESLLNLDLNTDTHRLNEIRKPKQFTYIPSTGNAGTMTFEQSPSKKLTHLSQHNYCSSQLVSSPKAYVNEGYPHLSIEQVPNYYSSNSSTKGSSNVPFATSYTRSILSSELEVSSETGTMLRSDSSSLSVLENMSSNMASDEYASSSDESPSESDTYSQYGSSVSSRSSSPEYDTSRETQISTYDESSYNSATSLSSLSSTSRYNTETEEST